MCCFEFSEAPENLLITVTPEEIFDGDLVTVTCSSSGAFPGSVFDYCKSPRVPRRLQTYWVVAIFRRLL